MKNDLVYICHLLMRAAHEKNVIKMKLLCFFVVVVVVLCFEQCQKDF